MWYTVSLAAAGRFYIGGTKQRRETRLRKHQDASERGMMEESGVVEHTWEKHHPIVWEKASMLDRARGQGELLLKEALHFQMTPVTECLNWERGLGCINEETGRGEQSSLTFTSDDIQ